MSEECSQSWNVVGILKIVKIKAKWKHSIYMFMWKVVQKLLKMYMILK